MASSKTPRCSPRNYISPRSTATPTLLLLHTPPPFRSTTFFLQRDLLLPSFERHCKPSFTRSGSLLGSRPLARIRARAGKLVSSFRVRRGRKRDFSRSSVDDSSKVGDNSFLSFAAVQSKSLSYLRFRRTLRVNFLAWRDNLVAKSLSTACRSSLQPELILSKERDETRYASRSEERR